MKKLFTLLSFVLLLTSCTDKAPYSLGSKKSNLTATLENNEGELTLSITEGDKAVISASPIAITIDDQAVAWELLSSSKSEVDATLALQYGEFDQVTVPYSDMDCSVRLSTDKYKIDGVIKVRLFEEAVAYQLLLSNCPEGAKLKEISSWIPADLSGACFSTHGEYEALGPLTIAEASHTHRTPFIYQTQEHIMAFHECDLFDYPQLFITGEEDGSSFGVNIDAVTLPSEFQLPYRVVMIGDNYADLHNQKPIYQTMSDEPNGDYSWVKPGLCMWDWRVKGTTFDGFTYEMTTESLKRYIDFCSKSNIEYFLIDAEWNKKPDPLTPVDELDIREVVAYGNSKNVGIILYYDLTYIDQEHPEVDFELIVKTYADFGVKGMKYGFLKGNNSQHKTVRTLEIIETLAKHQMVVVFHDSPIPFSGLERTHPNYINREYCHAQLDRRAAFNPRQAVKMACINLLAGHMDQTNGTYALNEMATRSKGPMNEYNSTVAGETARFFISHTGAFSVLIDAPEAYEQKADLFEFISLLPNSWDQTQYLDMDFNSHVAVAKRKGDRWYAGVIYNENGGEHTLSLEFLEPDATYSARIYRDAEDTDYITNKEAYTVETIRVNANDTIAVTVPAGGGFSVIFDKQ